MNDQPKPTLEWTGPPEERPRLILGEPMWMLPPRGWRRTKRASKGFRRHVRYMKRIHQWQKP